jgi:hypothetical protein
LRLSSAREAADEAGPCLVERMLCEQDLHEAPVPDVIESSHVHCLSLLTVPLERQVRAFVSAQWDAGFPNVAAFCGRQGSIEANVADGNKPQQTR